MLVNENIKINITNKNVSHYKTKGYDVKSGDLINVKIVDIPKQSKKIIKVICDICKKEKEITILSYNRNIQNYGYYACCAKCALEKTKKTNNIKYSVDHPLQNKDILSKAKNTKKQKYGDENFVNIEKQKQTNINKYGTDSYMKTNEFRINSKKTLLKKYNVDSYTKTDECKKRIKNTKKQKYGDENFVNIEKQKQTKKERYNDEYFNNREKYIKTCIKLYNETNPMKNENIKNRQQNSVFESFGVYHPAQNKEIFVKMLKSGLKIHDYKDTGLYYQGTYELDFLNKYYDIIDIKRGPMIKYMYENIEHIYFSDFYIEEFNLIVEIKSTKWYNEHIDKIRAKEKGVKNYGYNYILILNKDYEIFEKLIKHKHNRTSSWQYELRKKYLENDISELNIKQDNIKVADFSYEYISKKDYRTKEIKKFIEKYEWLGNMPNRPTHRFIATYNGILAGVIIISTPNSFSNMLGDKTKNIEKLISRGACASWTPKNLASSLLMWSINWMVKNTQFRIFTAYSDPEAGEIGTIYQACNFYYIGKKYGSRTVYFDFENPHLGWTSGRNFRKLKTYQKYSKQLGIKWKDDWSINYSILWDNIPAYINKKLKNKYNEKISNCIKRTRETKHKYVYIKGKDKKETKYLRKKFLELNKIEDYPKR